MPFISSPVQYPPTSSPKDISPRKRRKLEESGTQRAPLSEASPNVKQKTIAGFVIDDSDDEDETPFQSEPRNDYFKNKPHVPIEDTAARDNGNITEDIVPKTVLKLSPLAFQTTDTIQSATLTPTQTSSDQHPKSIPTEAVTVTNCSGRSITIRRKAKQSSTHYERIVAARSSADPGRAQKSYYGIDIHRLVEEASNDANSSRKETRNHNEAEAFNADRKESHPAKAPHQQRPTNLWTEKYRARKFTDLVGDERTHRSVLKWLKGWDAIVFPNNAKQKPKFQQAQGADTDGLRKKILLLTGPPGLGKTTLAHVCAKQAGYEVQEINASDERTRDVVKGRIRDMVGTENVRQANTNPNGNIRKAARPVCVVVDEVDGVVGGSGGGSGDNGFVKALADLLALDLKNSNSLGSRTNNTETQKKRKGDKFRMLRPIILICNDVYHPSLRMLRQGSMAETIYVRKPPLNMVVSRVQSIFEKEGLPCDTDGVRQLCEATWGVSVRKEDKTGGGVCEGDLRSVLVTAEWVASKFRAESDDSEIRLTKRWIQDKVVGDLSHGGGAARNLGRGGIKEVVDRVFTCNAGITPAGSASGSKSETTKKLVTDRLREIIVGCGEDDRAMLDCFTTYPTLPFQDDTFLTKPNHAYDWLHFHDRLSSLVHSSQEWELASYLPTPLLAFHSLFASTSRNSYANHLQHSTANPDPTQPENTEPAPFTGPRASHLAAEATKANRAALQHLHSNLTLPLSRVFRSPETLASDLLPYTLRMLSPSVKPVVVGGSDKSVASVRRAAEKDMIRRAVDAMLACGVRFERTRIGDGGADGMAAAAPRHASGATGVGGWIYRMEPALDALGVYETAGKEGLDGVGRTRFAVRQVLEQEWKREVARREQDARVRRMKGFAGDGVAGDEEALAGVDLSGGKKSSVATGKDKEKRPNASLKRDFFGRLVVEPVPDEMGAADAEGKEGDDETKAKRAKTAASEGFAADEGRVWVTYHEGFSNAVRKGITLKELLEGM